MSQYVALTGKQRAAIDALLTGCTVTEAAGRAGVSRKTLQRWMQEEGFRAALDGATAEALQELSRLLLTLTRDAAQAMRDALAGEQPIAVRLRAADALIGRLLTVRELVDLEERVAALEAAQHGQVG